MNQDHFLEVLEQHKGILYKVSNNYSNNREDQDDLIQEMTLQLYRSFDKYNEKFQWSTFIYRIALNVAISFYRKHKRTAVITGISSTIMEMPDPISLPIAENEKLGQLSDFIQNLRPLDKALMLLYLDQTSTSQMSDILGVSETNITSKIHRIKKKLRQQFDNHKV